MTVFLVMAVFMALCSGCTKKEDLVFSIQEGQVSEEPEENGTDFAQQDRGMSAKPEETAGSTTVSDDGQILELPDETALTEADVQSTKQPEIYVHVCGAVKVPGVYELPAGSRVYEAVQAAGGFTEDADASYVNQAQRLPDAVQLVIPTTDQVAALKQEERQTDTQTSDTQTDAYASRIGIISQDDLSQGSASDNPGNQRVSGDDGKININTATESQLCDIPGIGAAKASAIIAYRQEHGAFETIEDIMKINGIKQSTYDKMKDSIKVN